MNAVLVAPPGVLTFRFGMARPLALVQADAHLHDIAEVGSS